MIIRRPTHQPNFQIAANPCRSCKLYSPFNIRGLNFLEMNKYVGGSQQNFIKAKTNKDMNCTQALILEIEEFMELILNK